MSLTPDTAPEIPAWIKDSAGNFYRIGGGGSEPLPGLIDELGDVDTATTAPQPGDVLTWNGTQWAPQAAASPPLVIPPKTGLVGHWDAKNTNGDGTSVAEGAQVVTWADLSGNGRTLTGEGSSVLPIYTAGNISFDKMQMNCFTSPELEFMANLSCYCKYSINMPTVTDSVSPLFLYCAPNGASNASISMGIEYMTATGFQPDAVVGSGYPSATSYHILSSLNPPTSGVIATTQSLNHYAMYIDGALTGEDLTTWTYTPPFFGIITLGGISISSGYGVGMRVDLMLNGTISQVLIYSIEHDAATVAQISTWMANPT